MIVNEGNRARWKRLAKWVIPFLFAGLAVVSLVIIAKGGEDDEQFGVYALDEIQHLNILVSGPDWAKVKGKRDHALKVGILRRGPDDFVPIQLVSGGNVLQGRMRLKGDWVDHLQGEKWSFRIELEQPGALNGKLNFSIQEPGTRKFMREWMFHKLLEEADVLTTTYDFVAVSINQNNRGIFAMEEHFSKQLVESRSRREGPILKIDEEGLWEARVLEREIGREPKALQVAYPAAQIRMFNPKRILSDSILRPQFEIAVAMLQQFKDQKPSAREVFDLEKTARMLAIVDLTRTYHSLYWHNIRFFYNPVTCLIEPIIFDGNSDAKVGEDYGHALLGFESFPAHKKKLKVFFDDPAFLKRYCELLLEYTSDEFISSFLEKYSEEMKEKAALIKREYNDYSLDENALQSDANWIRKKLEVKRKLWDHDGK